MQPRTFRAAVALFLGTMLGCSGGQGNVTGKVLLDGSPLAGAEIQLYPQSDLRLGVCYAKTRADGTFEMIPDPRVSSKVRAGTYVVLISKLVPREGAVIKPDIAMPAEEGPAFRNVVPPEFGDPKRSPLVVEVKPGPNELQAFELYSRKE